MSNPLFAGSAKNPDPRRRGRPRLHAPTFDRHARERARGKEVQALLNRDERFRSIAVKISVCVELGKFRDADIPTLAAEIVDRGWSARTAVYWLRSVRLQKRPAASADALATALYLYSCTYIVNRRAFDPALLRGAALLAAERLNRLADCLEDDSSLDDDDS
ncbi:MAG: hypothetical protein WEB58_13645 [Planctomycetaceae bacterium]